MQRVVAGVAVGVVRPPGAGDTDEGVDGQEPLGGRVVGALPQPLETGHREPARGEQADPGDVQPRGGGPGAVRVRPLAPADRGPAAGRAHDARPDDDRLVRNLDRGALGVDRVPEHLRVVDPGELAEGVHEEGRRPRRARHRGEPAAGVPREGGATLGPFLGRAAAQLVVGVGGGAGRRGRARELAGGVVLEVHLARRVGAGGHATQGVVRPALLDTGTGSGHELAGGVVVEVLGPTIADDPAQATVGVPHQLGGGPHARLGQVVACHGAVAVLPLLGGAGGRGPDEAARGVVHELDPADAVGVDGGDPARGVPFVPRAGARWRGHPDAAPVVVPRPPQRAAVAGALDEPARGVPHQGDLAVGRGRGQATPVGRPGEAGHRLPVDGEVGHRARRVVGPGQALPVRLLLPDLAARGVVARARGPAQGVGLGGDLAEGHPAAAHGAAHRVLHLDRAAEVVVAVAGDPAEGVHGLDELPGSVVPEGAGAPHAVAQADHAPREVERPRGAAQAGRRPGDGAAQRVVVVPGDRAGGIGLGGQVPVGRVGEGRRGAQRVGDRLQAAAAVPRVPGGAAVRTPQADQAARDVPFQGGHVPERVDVLDGTAAAVVAGEPAAAVGGLHRDDAAQGVGAHDRRGVADRGAHRAPGGARGLHDVVGRVGGARRAAVDVVLLPPRAPLGGRDRDQPGQGVVCVLPGASVGQLDAGEVAQRVELPGHGAAERVGRAVGLAGLVALDRGAVAVRVGRRGRAAAGGELVGPHRAVGGGLRGQGAPGVVGEGRAVARGGDRGGHPTGVVTLEAGGVAVGVGRGDQVAVGVVGVGDGDPGRVGDRREQVAVPGQGGDAALGVDHPARVPVGPLVGVGRGGQVAVVVDDHLDGAVGLVVDRVDPRAGRQHLRGATAPCVELGQRDRPVTPGRHHQLPVGVIGHRLALVVGVDDPHEAALVVVQPRVRPRPVGVGDDGDAAGEVGEARGAAVAGDLGDHATLLVVGVDRLGHAVGVGHALDQPGGVPAVAAGRAIGRDRDQPAGLVVAVVHAAPVGGHQRSDAVVGPLDGDRAAALVGQAEQAQAVPRQLHPRARAALEAGQLPAGQELPAPAGVVGDRVAVARGIQPVGLGGRPTPAGTLPGEVHLAAVGVPPAGTLGVEGQTRLGHRGPARAERAHAGVQRVVQAVEPKGGVAAGEAQVALGLEEVARRGVHRVVGVPRGGRGAVGLRRVDRELRALGVHAGRRQRRRDRRVGGRHEAVAARGLEGRRHGVGPAHVLFVGAQVAVETGPDRGRLEAAEPAPGREVVVGAAEVARPGGEVVVGAPGVGREGAQVVGPGRRGAGAARALQGIADALLGLRERQRDRLGGRADWRILPAGEPVGHVVPEAPLVLPLLPRAGGLPPVLLTARLAGELVGPLGDLAQAGHQQAGV